MNAYLANLINALVLVGLGTWGYLSSESPSITALIPVGIGAILLICSPGVKKENKVIAHIAVVLTLLIFLGLIKPLSGAIGRSDTAAILRVVVMMGTTVLSLVYFVRSFIAARKSRSS
jgi:hypothetical protein